jgi:uncharacterized protein (TIGR03067 family)
MGALNGIWQPVRQELGGQPVPKSIFENQRLVLRDTTYEFRADSEGRGTVKYFNGRMDIYGTEGVNAGKHITARYTIEKGILCICYNLSGEDYPKNFKTAGDSNLFLSIYHMKD